MNLLSFDNSDNLLKLKTWTNLRLLWKLKVHISCLLRKITLLQKKCHPIVALLVTYWLQFEKRTILRLSLQPTIDQVHTILCTGSNKKEKSNRVTLSIVKYRRMRSQIHLTIWTNWMIQFTNNLNCRKSKKKTIQSVRTF